jgi:excisionase family DNA binding protein
MMPEGRPKTKARKTPSPELEVLKIGGCSRDAIKEARDDATPPRFMTVAEVAEYLHVSLATVHRLIRHGQIPAFRIGKVYRFDRNEIEKFNLANSS